MLSLAPLPLPAASTWHHIKQAVPLAFARCCLQVRPYLMADGGNVEFVEIDGPVVYLRLAGACGSCPSSLTTMTMGIKRRLMERIPVSVWGATCTQPVVARLPSLMLPGCGKMHLVGGGEEPWAMCVQPEAARPGQVRQSRRGGAEG